jgi:hypothetical protein
MQIAYNSNYGVPAWGPTQATKNLYVIHLFQPSGNWNFNVPRKPNRNHIEFLEN